MIGDAVRWTRSELGDKSRHHHSIDCYSMAAVIHDTSINNSRLISCDRDDTRDTCNSQNCCSSDLVLSASAHHHHHHHHHHQKQQQPHQHHLRVRCESDVLQLQHSRSKQQHRRPPPPPFLSSSQLLVVVILHSFLVFLACAKKFCLSTRVRMATMVKKLLFATRHHDDPWRRRSGSPTSVQRSSFVKFLLVILQVYGLSTIFVIGSVQATPSVASSNDFSTSWDKKFSGDEISSVYDYMSDSDYSENSVIGHYTPTWAVHIPDGDVDGRADRVARDHGFINHGKIFDDHYHFHHNAVSKRSIDASHHHQKRLEDDHRVHWSRQQQIKSRKKRDFIRMRPARTSSVSRVELNDPKWPQMWYLNRGNGVDMNVIPAWEQGITGKGVVVTILDDGLESDHPDLEHNYDPKASYDVNSHDDDPMPHYDMTDSNRHGTRCAGEVAATANNSLCSVGIAFGARVGGVRMLDGDVTDAVEARSLSLNPQHIDIYSASWGPDDDGKTVDGPGELATRAFIEGVTKGRGGKGSIFIWASGNGGRELDNCNCDGYTNSIWTLSISSATEEGHVPWYSEKCSSTLAATYSSGGQNEKQVVTTDLHHSCTTSHTGTSASAPLAAGIVALVLEANRNLTWRDLQHIVVRTAKPGNLMDPTWTKNGVGRRISHSFGYGLMDAAAMVKMAQSWQTVPEQQRCEINAPHLEHMIPAKRYITLQLDVQHCMGVNFLEHVQAKISLTSQRRGDIVIYLQSPAGTRVTLLTSRVHDVSRSGFNEWPFMSVHTWGEAPHGKWLLEVHNEGRFLAQITQWDLIFYGTDAPPQPDDPIQIRPGPFGSYGGDLDNNFLDPNPETMGQWRDMQQVGESHMEVQRTTNDQTNSACTNFIADHRCIECTPETFLYKERCWSHCPEQSYMVPEIPRNRNRNNKIHDNDQNDANPPDPINTDNNDADTIPRKRAVMPFTPHKKCASCHLSCLLCRGPEAFECLQCHSGYHLTMVSSEESYCYPATNGNNLSRATGRVSSADTTATDADDGNLMQDLNAFWSIVIPSITVIVLVVGLSLFGRCLIARWRNDTASYSYEKVAFDVNNDDLEVATMVKEEQNRDVPGTSGSYDQRRILVESSSDSDDDI